MNGTGDSSVRPMKSFLSAFSRNRIRDLLVIYKILPREPLYQVMLRHASKKSDYALIVGSSSLREAHTIVLANPRITVSVFEARVDTHHKNQRLAKFLMMSRRVRFYNAALVPRSMKSMRFIEGDHLSRVEEIEHEDTPDQAENVHYFSIEDLLDSIPAGSSVLVAMDVEGFEIDLLRDISDQVKRFREFNLLLEFHHRADNRHVEVVSIANACGLRPWLIESARGSESIVRGALSTAPKITGGGRALFFRPKFEQWATLVRNKNVSESIANETKILRSFLLSNSPQFSFDATLSRFIERI